MNMMNDSLAIMVSKYSVQSDGNDYFQLIGVEDYVMYDPFCFVSDGISILTMIILLFGILLSVVGQKVRIGKHSRILESSIFGVFVSFFILFSLCVAFMCMGY